MTKEITDGEVTRVAMRIAMTAFSQLQMESEHLDDVDILKQYIQMCPFVSAESPSIQAALNALQNNSNVGMEAKPQDVHSSRQVTAKDSENCSTKSVIVPNAVRKPVQRHSVVNIILILIRTIILDTPLAMVFAIYLGLVWTHRLNDLYFQKQFENLEWTKERAYHETTYYKRYCDSQDLTTRHLTVNQQLMKLTMRTNYMRKMTKMFKLLVKNLMKFPGYAVLGPLLEDMLVKITILYVTTLAQIFVGFFSHLALNYDPPLGPFGEYVVLFVHIPIYELLYTNSKVLSSNSCKQIGVSHAFSMNRHVPIRIFELPRG